MTCDVREFDKRELAKFRRVGFSEIGIARALHYCTEHSITPPNWVIQEASDLLIKLLRGDKPHRKGRLANYVTEFNQELRDTERWSAVREVREIRAVAREDTKAFARCPNRLPAEICSHAERKIWLKQSNFECAADLLRGRNAYATPSAIKQSYRRIECKRKLQPQTCVGAWFSDSFLKKLRLEQSHERRPGHKTLLFIDLSTRTPKPHGAAHGIASDRINNERRKSAQKVLGKESR
jgi:hypothetical protein